MARLSDVVTSTPKEIIDILNKVTQRLVSTIGASPEEKMSAIFISISEIGKATGNANFLDGVIERINNGTYSFID